jgi:septum formation inhibitor MinC
LSKQQSNQTSTTINAASTATTDPKAMNTNANADSFSDILETQIKASPKRFDKKEVTLNVEGDEERNHSSSSSYDDSPSFNLSRTISHDHSQFIISRKNQLKRYINPRQNYLIHFIIIIMRIFLGILIQSLQMKFKFK